MGPTQGYRNGEREARNLWAFPILHLDRAAGFEEMSTEGYSSSEIERWLAAVTDFTAAHRSVRLMYFHPPGILPYHEIVENWLKKTAQLKTQGSFRWYTMAQVANFLNSRKRVEWTLTERGDLASLKATDSKTLAHQTWSLPTDTFGRPVVIRGAVTVWQDGDAWIVDAGEGNKLEVQARISRK
jgi:hypothetical protein